MGHSFSFFPNSAGIDTCPRLRPFALGCRQCAATATTLARSRRQSTRLAVLPLCAATTFLRRCCGLGTLTARVPAGDPRCRDDQAEGGGGCCALCALSFFSPASVRGVARARRSRRYLTLRRMSRTDSAEIEHLRRQQRQGVRIARGALEQARDDLNTSVRHEPMSSSNLRLG